MRISQVMTPSVQSCRPGESLERAAQVMWEHDCGCVPVCDESDGRVDGVVSLVGMVSLAEGTGAGKGLYA
jgi:CBS domain-containing protein